MSVYTDAFEAIVAAGTEGKVYEVAKDASGAVAGSDGLFSRIPVYCVTASKAQAALEVVGEDKVHLLTKADKNEILIKKLSQDAKEKAADAR